MKTRDGSHGLDLSFVTHIFLMDTIFDESLENQVVSRAYRMGAVCPVVVEQLIMSETVEEQIFRYFVFSFLYASDLKL